MLHCLPELRSVTRLISAISVELQSKNVKTHRERIKQLSYLFESMRNCANKNFNHTVFVLFIFVVYSYLGANLQGMHEFVKCSAFFSFSSSVTSKSCIKSMMLNFIENRTFSGL